MQRLDFPWKKNMLLEIYRKHDEQGAPFREEAVCGPGCAYCCTHYGHLDITTFEGMIIKKWIEAWPQTEQDRIQKRLAQNRRAKEKKKHSVCPFLQSNETCLIYEQRPFSCRQLYSLKKCGEHGPLVHPQAVDLARQTVRQIKQLDATGYSGHLSFILALLEQKPFFRLYTSGGFDPAKIAGFGQSHGLSINKQCNPGNP